MANHPVYNNSMRFYWCEGCGVWHDPFKDKTSHLAMYCPLEPPRHGNFDGTLIELERFIKGRELQRDDAEDFERRITEGLFWERPKTKQLKHK